MPTNDFIGFAAAGSANVMSQADYAAAAEQTDGVRPGPASSALANKIWRQGANMAAALGEIIKAQGLDALDNGDIAALTSNLVAAYEAFLLPLSGGTMSGTIVATTHPALSRQNDNSYLTLCGGTAANVSNGAFMYLYGANSAQPGAFRIYTGGTSHTLFGKSDGTLTWDGSNIVTEANMPLSSQVSTEPYAYKLKLPTGTMIQGFSSFNEYTDANGRITWTFPEAFLEYPFVAVSKFDAAQSLNIYSLDKTRVIYRVNNMSGTNVGSGVKSGFAGIAVGRWK